MSFPKNLLASLKFHDALLPFLHRKLDSVVLEIIEKLNKNRLKKVHYWVRKKHFFPVFFFLEQPTNER